VSRPRGRPTGSVSAPDRRREPQASGNLNGRPFADWRERYNGQSASRPATRSSSSPSASSAPVLPPCRAWWSPRQGGAERPPCRDDHPPDGMRQQCPTALAPAFYLSIRVESLSCRGPIERSDRRYAGIRASLHRYRTSP